LSLALAISRIAMGMAITVLLFNLLRPASGRRPIVRRRMTMALATLVLGLSIFALFYGLVSACDRL
jgi:hypothetical protein